MAVLVQDLFNGTAGTDISAHAPDIDVVGGGWLDNGANLVELDGSGAIKFSSSIDNCRINTGTADQIVTANFNAGGVDNRASLTARSNNAAYTSHTSYALNARPATGDLVMQKRIAGLGTNLVTVNLPLSASTTYELELRCIGSSIIGKVDGVTQISITDTSVTTGNYAGLVHNLYTDSAARFYDFLVEDTAGGTIDVPTTLGTIAYAGQNTTVSITGSVDVTATLGTLSYASNNTTVGVTGSVDVLTTLGTITYTSNDTTVSVSGAVDVTATLGTINYASNDAVVGITGSVDVVATLGTINYTSNNPVVSIGGVVVVQATLGTISYASNDTVISLQGAVSVPATLGTISYASNDTVVSLAGLIDVNATLGTISYTSNNTTVTVAAGQTFGVVGVGFADDVYSSTFKPDSITVNFRG